MISGAETVSVRHFYYWGCLYNMGLFFYFLTQIAPSPAAQARTMLQGSLLMSPRGNGVRNSRSLLSFGPQLNGFMSV